MIRPAANAWMLRSTESSVLLAELIKRPRMSEVMTTKTLAVNRTTLIVSSSARCEGIAAMERQAAER
jgi:hypothetical protein